MLKIGTYETKSGIAHIYHMMKECKGMVFRAVGVVERNNGDEEPMRWNPDTGDASSLNPEDAILYQSHVYLIARDGQVVRVEDESAAVLACLPRGNYVELVLSGGDIKACCLKPAYSLDLVSIEVHTSCDCTR